MTYLIVGGALIQSTFGVGNFEVVVFSPPFGNNPLGALTHYWLDTSRPPNVWQRGRDISIAATGAGCIIQSSFGSPATSRSSCRSLTASPTTGTTTRT